MKPKQGIFVRGVEYLGQHFLKLQTLVFLIATLGMFGLSNLLPSSPVHAAGDTFTNSTPSVSSITSSSAVISWGTTSAATDNDFAIEYDTKAQNLGNQLFDSGSTSKTSFSFTLGGLQPNTTYYVKVSVVTDPDTAFEFSGTDVAHFTTAKTDGTGGTTGGSSGATPCSNQPSNPNDGSNGHGALGQKNCADQVPSIDPSYPGCIVDSAHKGVLTSHVVIDGLPPKSELGCYVQIAFTENMVYVLIGATLLIMLSGIEYMLSGGSAAALTKAKQRIAGICGGMILYFLIRFIAPIIANGLGL